MLDACFGNNLVTISQRRYLGSKTKLLGFIEEILNKEEVKYNSFADIFGGTGVVSDFFHSKTNIIVNDILESNHLAYIAFFDNQIIDLDYLDKIIKKYNNLDAEKISHNYFSKNFANTYFDLPNSKLIGFIREDIEALYKRKRINKRERAYLITSLIYALDRIANTVGHYDAYRKIKIPFKKLELRNLKIEKRKRTAQIYKKDANSLVREVSADIVYLDPPYNSRQYSDAYHLLENVATWGKQKVYGTAKKIDRSHIKSKYSLRSAGNAFSDLINNINAKFILVSYNDMGTSGASRSQSTISDHEIISALERRGDVKIYEKAFNQFTTGSSVKNDLKERIFFCRINSKKKEKPSKMLSEQNTHFPEYIKSPLNYTGGKHKLLPQLTKLFPQDVATFYDVFCGGANIGLNAKAKKIVCIDKSQQLIDLLKFIQSSNFENLNQNIISIIEKFKLSQSYVHGYEKYSSQSSNGLGLYNKNSFLALRETFNTDKNIDRNLFLLLLIFYSFNNQIRFNSRGHFNLPVGKRDYNGSSRKNLAHFNAVTNLKKINFTKGDFRDLNKIKLAKKDFVYLDPPYLLGLASYNEAGGWSLDDEYDLYITLNNLHKKGIRFALSNVVEHKGLTNNTLLDFARKNNFSIHPIKHDYKNSNYQSTAKNNTTREVLITNY